MQGRNHLQNKKKHVNKGTKIKSDFLRVGHAPPHNIKEAGKKFKKKLIKIFTHFILTKCKQEIND